MNNSIEKAKCMKSAICEAGIQLTEDDLVNVSGGTDHVVGGTVSFQDITVQNCYNTGCLRSESNQDVGGIVGSHDATVQDCYNTGSGLV